MKKISVSTAIAVSVLLLLFAVPSIVLPQQAGDSSPAQNPAQSFRPEELDQMLAPIALYPDALLAVFLTAATYPVDIVAADRFVKAHPKLKGQALGDAAKNEDWSPNVKAMLQFPDVLAMMDNQLEWTTRVGDAFLAQQRDVMDSIQRLRQKAYAQGNLSTNKQEIVTAEPQTQTIVIEPAAPDVIYVPVYDPYAVYGPWWYPDYPPFICTYPGFIGGFFLPGCFVSIDWGWWSWGCDWRRHIIIVNINNFNRFTMHSFVRPERFSVRSAGRANVAWRHNEQFRAGARYRDFATEQRFRGRQAASLAETSAASNLQFRGFERGETLQRRQPLASTVSANAAIRPTTTQVNMNRSRENISVFSGIGSGATERAASFRGESSSRSVQRTSGFRESRAGGEVSPAGATGRSEPTSHGGGGGAFRGGAGRGGQHDIVK